MTQIQSVATCEKPALSLSKEPAGEHMLPVIVDRHGGDAGVRTSDCSNLFRVIAFSQLTWRESLRAIESCLAANQGKLFTWD